VQSSVATAPVSEHEKKCVKVICSPCDAVIEANNADAIADVFVAHGREIHTWTYPEEAIRNYYADVSICRHRKRCEEIRIGTTFESLRFVYIFLIAKLRSAHEPEQLLRMN